ncbi:MAG: hypothetical protein L3J28_13260 [Candidatus Polarisedimenticolaceae bacterium]|nr:hypothetical protein [Candidatus Polarisedimenticolaceae bacterium]
MRLIRNITQSPLSQHVEQWKDDDPGQINHVPIAGDGLKPLMIIGAISSLLQPIDTPQECAASPTLYLSRYLD